MGAGTIAIEHCGEALPDTVLAGAALDVMADGDLRAGLPECAGDVVGGGAHACGHGCVEAAQTVGGDLGDVCEPTQALDVAQHPAAAEREETAAASAGTLL